MLQRLSFIVTTVMFWHLCSPLAVAESKKLEQLDKFPPSPLEITTPDPLIRGALDKQPLTLAEMEKLKISLDELNQEAVVTLQGGDKVKAFEIWNRELRLRRFLGSLAEVEALSRVGAIAWNENEGDQVKYITQRLQVIEKQMLTQKSTDLELWRSLGDAYQKIRVPKLAVGVYQQVLVLVRQQNDTTAELETLNTIGEIHLSWFDYSSAATTYQELLKLAANKDNRLSEVAYLQQLAYIYEKAKQHQQGIDVLSKLVDIYTNDNNLTQVPGLKIAIASNYESLAQKNPNLRQEAFNNYQEAYTIAWQLQQYVSASEALQKLITLYRSQKQIDEALQASQILLETEKLATNFYGLMQAYDQIGQLYSERQEYLKALTAFQKGLEIAQQLKHEETYFTQKIDTLSKTNF
ncbi:tetratricopeptide repeat protein [Anabaena catenula]|uniref:Tetratricopeptide repeat protein n=1 Tax=Anabaena catenula FACHB-362 TaxID=2692877 RepID=A0ABR8JA88_9NOST|nr:tetratricopeptide repeat protein [Anabaena catenula]MBD2693911.1 tetratricopeptide repeat protein [Anabaena catenula FACHB-362]